MCPMQVQDSDENAVVNLAYPYLVGRQASRGASSRSSAGIASEV